MHPSNDAWLMILDILIDEWIEVRTPLYNTPDVFVSGYACSTKDQLCKLASVCRIFRDVLTPHLFHTLVFRPPSLSPPSRPGRANYRQFCEEFLNGNPRASAIADMVKQCIFVRWSSSSEIHQYSSNVRRMNDDLRAVKKMKNIRSLLFNDSVLPLPSIRSVLESLPNVDQLCLGSVPTPVDMSELSSFPTGNIRDLTINECCLPLLPKIPLPNLRTLRMPFSQSSIVVFGFFRGAVSIPTLKSLHLDDHFLDVRSAETDIVVHPRLALESITCPLMLAPVLFPNQPLETIRLRPSTYEVPFQHCIKTVSALESTTGRLQELEVPYCLCTVPDWLLRMRTATLRKLHITFRALRAPQNDIQYDQLWNDFEKYPLTYLEELTVLIESHQIDLPFQRQLIARLTPFLPSMQRFCFSQFMEWRRNQDGWYPKLSIEPGTPLSWFREYNTGLLYVVSSEFVNKTTMEVLVDDVGLLERTIPSRLRA